MMRTVTAAVSAAAVLHLRLAILASSTRRAAARVDGGADDRVAHSDPMGTDSPVSMNITHLNAGSRIGTASESDRVP